ECGRVEAVVHQALGDILGGDAEARLEVPHVEDALVGNPPPGALVEHRKVRLEPRGDVVRVEDGVFAREANAAPAHHPQVHPGDGEDRGAAVWRRRDGARATGEGIAGQVGRQVRGHADGAHAGPAAAVRDAERLVQVHVADVGPDVARAGDAGHRVEVRAVHVDL